ncbi:unnamed protein product, partial [Brenthis ino]
MAQNLIKGKKILKKEELIKAGEYYIRSTILGALISGSSSTIVCILRWMSGRKMNYYNYILIPGTLNGVFISLEPPKRRGLVINLFCNLVIEYWLRALQRNGYISITKTKLTFLFMVGSALLFYLMRLEGDKDERTPLLWLFTVEKVRHKKDELDNVCPHKGSCLQHISQGALKYFGIGFGINVARVLLSRLSSPWKAILRARHFDLALFFASYIGIYRAVICYLCRKRGVDSAMYALPAGCLAGLSFIFKPSLGFAIASLTGAFKLFSTILYEKEILTDRVPLPVIMYCLSQGLLFHTRMMDPEVCPQYIFKVMSSVSNGRSDELHANLLKCVSK